MTALLYGSFCAILMLLLAVVLTPLLRARNLTLRRRCIIAGCAFIISCAVMFAVYFQAGAPEVVALSAEREQRLAQLRQSIMQLSQRAKEQPEEVEAWMGLGDAFLQSGQHEAAAQAFREAVKLTGGHPAAIMAYARAMVAEAEGRVTDAAKQSLEMVLLQDSGHPEARYWMAVRSLQEGKAPEAMQALRDLYRSLPDDAPLKAHIDRQIGRAD